ncbi:P-loop NTPase [Arthrobacter ginkgonis]|uniref:P-loop NTPase n=1 Tax=Arthrobacter ginkgonis TaxID=1630594 RepID=A0ABP7CBT2_9MICC
MSVAVVVWGENGALVEGLERLRGAVTVVRRCAELTEVVALAETGLADAALLAGDPGLIDAPVLDALAGRGILAVVLTNDPGEAARLGGLGAAVESPGTDAQALSDLLEMLVAGAVGTPAAGAGLAGPERAGTQVPDPGPAMAGGTPAGRIVAVWGPAGSPGRTTVAVNFAAEAALAGRRVVLLDADTYGASVAAHLGLLDESAGLAHLCRLADQFVLDGAGFERACSVVAVAGTRLRVATGISRPARWPELRPEALARVLEFLRRQADVVVVDVSFCLEADEDLSFDTSAPQRNGAALAVLEAADEVLAVGAADSVGVPRLVKGVEELRAAVPGCEPAVVFNRVRASAVGPSPERQLRLTWERFGPEVRIKGFLPQDAAAADLALHAGSVLAEAAPNSALRSAVAALAGAGPRRRAPLLARRRTDL